VLHLVNHGIVFRGGERDCRFDVGRRKRRQSMPAFFQPADRTVKPWKLSHSFPPCNSGRILEHDAKKWKEPRLTIAPWGLAFGRTIEFPTWMAPSHDHRLPRPLHHRTQGPASFPQGTDGGCSLRRQDGDAAARRLENVRRRDP